MNMSAPRRPVRSIVSWLAVAVAIGGLAIDRPIALLAQSESKPPSTVPPTNRQAALDPGFVSWLKGYDGSGYRELSRRFLRACGHDTAAYDQSIDRLRQRLESKFDKAGRPHGVAARCRILSDVCFNDVGLQADPDLNSLDNLLPDRILAKRRGYCLGLSLVILGAVEPLGWPITAVSAPRHTFLRYRGEPRAINIETTRSGQNYADAWYRQRFEFGRDGIDTVRELTLREVAAHLINNHGFALLDCGDLDAAGREFAWALELAPKTVEARINLGVRHARASRYGAARREFERALTLWPDDPLLQLNRIQALRRSDVAADTDLAIADLIRVARDHPKLRAVVDAIEQVSSTLDPIRDWESVQRLSMARLASLDVRPGLAAEYFDGRNFEKRRLRRVDRNLSFDWGWQAPVAGVGRDDFSARWTGIVEIPATDRYTFFITCSDGIRLWIDDRQVVNAWRRGNENFSTSSIALLAGRHTIRVEYFETIGDAGVLVMLTCEARSDVLDLEPLLMHESPPK